ncbi:hypothetical protein [Bacteroides acidifaciens]|uniref:hypothetical protein n=1 Tax=Bacteroides acidifaciens TaxID=85831 RepID=UPI00263B0663|nr:hypothetical protein [Bacteroides acidifaciens]
MDIKLNLSDEIIKLLDYLFEKMGIAVDWSSENILPYILELMNKVVQYTMWRSVLTIAIVVVFAFIGMRLYLKFVNWEDIVDYNEKLWDGIARFVIVAVTCLVIWDEGVKIVTCLTFPEKIAIEYIQDMMNKGEKRGPNTGWK